MDRNLSFVKKQSFFDKQTSRVVPPPAPPRTLRDFLTVQRAPDYTIGGPSGRIHSLFGGRGSGGSDHSIVIEELLGSFFSALGIDSFRMPSSNLPEISDGSTSSPT